jgi:hypothetical protein
VHNHPQQHREWISISISITAAASGSASVWLCISSSIGIGSSSIILSYAAAADCLALFPVRLCFPQGAAVFHRASYCVCFRSPAPLLFFPMRVSVPSGQCFMFAFVFPIFLRSCFVAPLEHPQQHQHQHQYVHHHPQQHQDWIGLSISIAAAASASASVWVCISSSIGIGSSNTILSYAAAAAESSFFHTAAWGGTSCEPPRAGMATLARSLCVCISSIPLIYTLFKLLYLYLGSPMV